MSALIPWSTLPRATDDNETIEEAIARLIADHEADPTAHLGEGESLSEHKGSEVIDHLAGSVVVDKYSRAESLSRAPMFDLSGFTTLGSSSRTFSHRTFSHPTGSPYFGYWYASLIRVGSPAADTDFTVRISGFLQSSSSSRWSEWGVSWDPDTFTDSSLGPAGYSFYAKNLNLYAVTDVDGTRTETFIKTFGNNDGDLVMSIEYDHFTGDVSWYLGDTLVYSEPISDFWGDEIPNFFFVRSKGSSSGTDPEVTISSLLQSVVSY